jgi:hypothetical protein
MAKSGYRFEQEGKGERFGIGIVSPDGAAHHIYRPFMQVRCYVNLIAHSAKLDYY